MQNKITEQQLLSDVQAAAEMRKAVKFWQHAVIRGAGRAVYAKETAEGYDVFLPANVVLGDQNLSFSHVEFLTGFEVIGDVSVQVANAIDARIFAGFTSGSLTVIA